MTCRSTLVCFCDFGVQRRGADAGATGVMTDFPTRLREYDVLDEQERDLHSFNPGEVCERFLVSAGEYLDEKETTRLQPHSKM